MRHDDFSRCFPEAQRLESFCACSLHCIPQLSLRVFWGYRGFLGSCMIHKRFGENHTRMYLYTYVHIYIYICTYIYICRGHMGLGGDDDDDDHEILAAS